MSRNKDQIENLLDRVAAGDLDDLTPEQIAALEVHLNASPALAARLADERPPADTLLESLGAELPSESEWDEAWSRIAPASRVMRGLRFGAFARTITAAAACVLLAFVYQVGPSRASAGEPWELSLATDVEIHELDVAEDVSSAVSYADDGEGPVVIWLFEDEEVSS